MIFRFSIKRICCSLHSIRSFSWNMKKYKGGCVDPVKIIAQSIIQIHRNLLPVVVEKPKLRKL